MESERSPLPLSAIAINAVLLLVATVAAVGAALPLWPNFSLHYMGRSSPIENFILMAFDYPGGRAWFGLGDVDLGVRVPIMAPVVLQTVLIIVVAILVVRLLSDISRGTGFRFRAQLTLKALTIVGIGGGLLQFTVGIVAWRVGRGLWDLDASVVGDYQVALISAFPFPQWPLVLILIGVVAMALGVAFRAAARSEQELEGVV